MRWGRKPALASVLVVGGLVVFMLAIIGLAINLTGFLDAVYMDLALTLPRFEYSFEGGAETGNEIFGAFAQMRFAAGGVMGMALLWAGLARVLEGAGTVAGGTSNRVISRSLMYLVLFLVFPIVWDGSAAIMEGAALWVLNPNYTFDPSSPCPKEWSDQYIVEQYNASPYSRGAAGSASEAEIFCEPRFKIRYIFDQMMGHTELQSTKDAYLNPEDPFSALTEDIQNLAESVLVNTFLGLTKALVTINVLLMAFVVGIMADLLVGMIIAAFPLFLMLSLIPRVDSVANRFLDALPALFLLPLLSAVVISVGAGFMAQIGEGPCAGGMCPEPGAGSQAGLLYMWVSSLGVVFFAVTLPVLLVPLLGQVTQAASRTLTGAVQAAGTVAGSGALGAARGVRAGLSQKGQTGGLSGLARTAAAGTLGGLAGAASAATKASSSGFGSASLPKVNLADAPPAVRGAPPLDDAASAAMGDVQRGLEKLAPQKGGKAPAGDDGGNDSPGPRAGRTHEGPGSGRGGMEEMLSGVRTKEEMDLLSERAKSATGKGGYGDPDQER